MSEDLVARALHFLRNRDFAAARNSIKAFAEENTLELQHYLLKGICDLALQDWSEAQLTFSDAARFFPHQPQIWFNLGIAQENLGLIDDAVESFEHSLDLNPDQGEACGNLSNLYRKQNRYKEAETMAHKAYELGAPKAQALNALGLALERQGRLDAAEKIFRQALEIEPGQAHALANLANCAVDRLDFNAAWPLFAAARVASSDPIIRFEESIARLLAGDFATGWPLYESRLDRPGFLRNHPKAPVWRGESLAGKKLLLVAEQGLGDTIQFCRYALPLAREGVELIWRVPEPLRRLMAENMPGHVLAENDGEAGPAIDYWLPLMSLPLATHKMSFADAPPAPYLRATPGPHLPDSKKNMRKIGLVWAGSPTHERALERSMDLALFAPLLKEVKAQYYAPFKGAALDGLEGAPIIRLDHLIQDFGDTAALLMQMGCLVTVDTSVAHLAGALGIKTYILIPYCPDWRWGISGTTTPWYPTVKLLRQTSYGDWEGVIRMLIEEFK